eukprot:m.255991 g.255991  ORF g.255991 m.255991 type:complete len:251 (-) comp20679_c0_seq1:207-959(-)
MPPVPEESYLFGWLSLTAEEREWMVVDLQISFGLQLVSFLIFKSLYRHPDPTKTTRGLSWFLSSVVAAVQSFLGLMYAVDFLRIPFDPNTTWSDDRISRFSNTFFGVFMLLDLFLGAIFYPKYLDPLSGWVHHTYYVLLIVHLLNGRATRVMMPGYSEEIPTLLLALGSIFPQLRNDLLFGLLFFVTRILFHIYYSAHLIASYRVHDHPAVLWTAITCMIAIAMHLYWFFGWSRNLYKYLGKADKSKKKL